MVLWGIRTSTINTTVVRKLMSETKFGPFFENRVSRLDSFTSVVRIVEVPFKASKLYINYSHDGSKKAYALNRNLRSKKISHTLKSKIGIVGLSAKSGKCLANESSFLTV